MKSLELKNTTSKTENSPVGIHNKLEVKKKSP